MGWLSKAAGAIGDAVKGVAKGIGKVFKTVGGWVKKALGNEWVQKGLMAAGIITGGIAITNGIMVGFKQASAAQGFLGKFVAGSKGFVSGMAQGLGSPLQTAKGIKDAAMGAGAPAQAISGLPASPADQLAGEAAGGALSDRARDIVAEGVVPVGGTPGMDPGLAAEVGKKFSVQDFGGMGMPQSVENLSLGGDALAGQIAQQAGPAESAGWLQTLKNSATSPMGVLALSNMVQGYAAGAAREKELRRIDREEKRRRESYRGFADTAPTIPSLSQLGRMRRDVGASRRDIVNRYRGG